MLVVLVLEVHPPSVLLHLALTTDLHTTVAPLTVKTSNDGTKPHYKVKISDPPPVVPALGPAVMLSVVKLHLLLHRPPKRQVGPVVASKSLQASCLNLNITLTTVFTKILAVRL